jgi:hypothetical protein
METRSAPRCASPCWCSPPLPRRRAPSRGCTPSRRSGTSSIARALTVSGAAIIEVDRTAMVIIASRKLFDPVRGPSRPIGVRSGAPIARECEVPSDPDPEDVARARAALGVRHILDSASLHRRHCSPLRTAIECRLERRSAPHQGLTGRSRPGAPPPSRPDAHPQQQVPARRLPPAAEDLTPLLRVDESEVEDLDLGSARASLSRQRDTESSLSTPVSRARTSRRRAAGPKLHRRSAAAS